MIGEQIKDLENWIINSGIQNTQGEKKHLGGFNSWFNLDFQEYPFIYTEITGYGITLLLFLYELDQNKIFLQKAQLAGDWIINCALHSSGGVYTRSYYQNDLLNNDYSFENGNLYTFDTGMVLFGILKLYKFTKNEIYLEISKRMVDFILKMQKDNGGFFSFYNPKNNQKYDNDDKWSNQSGAYQSKILMGLYDFYEISHDEKIKLLIIKSCEFALQFQELDGRFITQRKNGSSLLHPHCYAVEGLFYCGLKMNEQKFIDSAIKGIQWSFSNQMENGGIPQLFHEGSFIKFERTDILAQVLRMGLFINHHSKKEIIIKEKLERLRNRILEFQNKDEIHKGGIKYGYENDGSLHNHVNSWCSFFSLQAFYNFKFVENNVELKIDFLI